MKKLITFSFLLNCAIQTSDQNEKNVTHRLNELCKIWGVLKYYHPKVGTGLLNADSLLVVNIPLVKGAKNQIDYESIIERLVTSAGETEKCDTCTVKKDNLVTFLDWNWIGGGSFNGNTKRILNRLRDTQASFKNVYVTDLSPEGDHNGFPTFNEKAYDEMQFPNENYRLLSLFRIWNIVNYFFPYKNMMDNDWVGILEKFTPLFIAASNADEYHLLVKELMTYLNDGHAFASSDVSNKHFYNYRAPFEVLYVHDKYVVGNPINDSLFSLTRLKVGDVITSIDGKSVELRKQYLAKYFGGSNRAGIDGMAIADVLLNGIENTGSISVLRTNKTITYPLKRYKYSVIHASDEKKRAIIWKRLKPNIGYVNMEKLVNRDTVKYLFKNLQDTDGLILDFRNHPEFSVMYEFLSYASKANRPFAKFLSPVMEYPGYFYYRSDGFDFVPLKPESYKGKIILLVNEHSWSIGEFFPMALQMNSNVVTIGSQTWGGDGNQVGTVLPGKIYVGFSGLGIFYPDGSVCQRKGIKIDIEIKPTISGIQQGRDEVLEKAVGMIAQQ